MAKKKVLVLRTCKPDMSSTNGFKWPESGYVEAPDWKPTNECGNGLHGWLWGGGDGSLGNWREDAKWLVVEVDVDKVIDLDGKVKFPFGKVVFCGSRLDATNYLVRRAPDKAVIGAAVVAGDYGTATAGDYGTATVGKNGTATAGHGGKATAGHGGKATVGDRGTATAGKNGTATTGNYSMATAGDGGTATAGERGTATAGYCGTATAGNYGTATAGERGTATAGYCGTATAGDYGTATAGNYGTATAGKNGTATAGKNGAATAGYYGTATAGYCGTATAGEGGRLCLEYCDGERYRIRVAYVGENGILPNVPYRLDSDGNFIKEN